eukprot:jgi/Botrbrau1/10517/Bobra.7_1s0001.1
MRGCHKILRLCSNAPKTLFEGGQFKQNCIYARQRSTLTGGGLGSVSDDLLKAVKDKTLLRPLGLIGGEWVGSADGTTFEVQNPATTEVIATLPRFGANETRAAIAEAGTAWPTYGALTGRERCLLLRRWYEAVQEAEEDICTIMTMESGKPLAESRGEFVSGVQSIEWFSEEARRVDGDVLQTTSNNRRMLVLRQPLGVAAAITPWNFPMSMITRKVAPALAAGCPVVLKPAEKTPLTALALAELAQRAGFPPGILNVVFGDDIAIGNMMMQSDTVRKLGFTGSTAVGKLLYAGSAGTMKRISLELGGNAPFLVFDDADLELAAKGVVLSAFRNAGQTCICANRIFVQAGIYDDFAAAVTERASRLKEGGGLDPNTTMGPLISTAALARVQGHADDALAKGGKLMIGGSKPALAAPYDKGHFFSPTIVRDATIDMKLYREETFGPALGLFKFSTEAEAIQLANDTEYGLAGYFYTKDLARAWRIAEQLEYGMIGVNEVAITDPVAPFGGIKHSGLGRESSKYGIDEFLYLKYVAMGLGYSRPGLD